MNQNIPRSQGSRLKRVNPDHGNKFAYDEVDQVSGEWNRLLRKLREKYGYSNSEAQDEQIEYLMEKSEEEEVEEDSLEDPSADDPDEL